METEKETCTRPKWMTKLLGCSRAGGISSEQLPGLLTQLSPGLNIDGNVLNRIISQHDPTGSGVLDFDTVTKIVFQVILKQPSNSGEEEQQTFTGDLRSAQQAMQQQDSDCCCTTPGSCSTIKITDFIIFPTF